MFRSSWDRHQAVLNNTTKVNSTVSMDPYLVKSVHIIKLCLKLRCENYNIFILTKYCKYKRNLYLKILVDNIIPKVIKYVKELLYIKNKVLIINN
jgi:hypothetical protein